MAAGETEYWTVSKGVAVTATLSCRECRKPIPKGAPIFARDGRKVRLYYHPECFSGEADPRTQKKSSFHEGRLPQVSETAPKTKGKGKWTVRSYGLAAAAAASPPSPKSPASPSSRPPSTPKKNSSTPKK